MGNDQKNRQKIKTNFILQNRAFLLQYVAHPSAAWICELAVTRFTERESLIPGRSLAHVFFYFNFNVFHDPF